MLVKSGEDRNRGTGLCGTNPGGRSPQRTRGHPDPVLGAEMQMKIWPRFARRETTAPRMQVLLIGATGEESELLQCVRAGVSLLVTQGNNRIDLHGSPRWDVAR